MTEIEKDRLEERYDKLVAEKDCEVCCPICKVCGCKEPCACNEKPKSAFSAMPFDRWLEGLYND